MENKEYFCIIQEETFNSLPSELRLQFSNVEVRESNEWQNNKSDTVYLALYQEKKKASKKLRDYLYDKRHKQ
jgi:hypothetical protein